MAKIKTALSSPSLRKSLALYVAVFTLAALLLIAITESICSIAANSIEGSYPKLGQRYYLTTEQGQRLGEGTYIYTQPPEYSDADRRLLALLDILPPLCAPIYSALCLFAAVELFYHRELKEPLKQLREASAKIQAKDLDFVINCGSRNELGQLCASFETMRSKLADNFSQMWQQMEERKRLNAAFAHDLRTPLTVLKGYDELLLTSSDSHTREAAETMARHIGRMEAYVDSMSRIQRLEDIQPQPRRIQLASLEALLQESARLLCAKADKSFFFRNTAAEAWAYVDSSLIDQVCTGLISNALRYATSAVELLLDYDGAYLCITVKDDGPGFDPMSLKKAADPYYTAAEDRSQHFGLGLYIASMLCRDHGGQLEIANGKQGAEVKAFFRDLANVDDK